MRLDRGVILPPRSPIGLGFTREVVLPEEYGVILLSSAANLADRDNTVNSTILDGAVEHFDEDGIEEWVTTDTNAAALVKANLDGLINGLVGYSAHAVYRPHRTCGC